VIRTLSLALALCLVGCAGDAEWSKDGVSPEAAARELADCRSEAQEATQRDTNIDTDILASRGRDWQQTGVLGMKVASDNEQNRNLSGDMVQQCMIGKGFAPGG
jgi:hypothetical protein